MMLALLAKTLARPAVVDRLIQRAKRTPYFHLVDADGSVYMERYWLFNPHPPKSDGADRRWGNWLPSIRLHKIMREDRDRHHHDHPWDFRTFILRGWYWEQREGVPGFIVRLDGTTATLKFGEYHHITRVSDGGVWTLFISWKKRGTWGFLVNGKKVPWREYLGVETPVAAPKVPSYATGGMFEGGLILVGENPAGWTPVATTANTSDTTSPEAEK